MEKSYFPGYSRCVACHEMIAEKDIRNHLLNCRPRSSIEKKLCTSCNKQFDNQDFDQHIQLCKQQNIPSDSISLLKKKCPICEKLVENLSLHCETCVNNSDYDNNDYATPRAQTPNQIENNSKKKETKYCILCSQYIDESQFEEHLSSCSSQNHLNHSDENKSSSQIENNSKTKERKYCVLCSQHIDQEDFQEHIATCSNENDVSITNNNKNYSQNEKNSTKKECPLCSQQINQSEYENHVESCSIDDRFNRNDLRRSSSKKMQRTTNSKSKQCPLCSQNIDQFLYENHVESCSNDNRSPSIDSSQKQSKKECIMCSQSIDEDQYVDHVRLCTSQTPSPSNNSFDKQDDKNEIRSSASGNVKTRKDCILCFKPIDLTEYENHVLACLAQTDNQPNSSTIPKNLKCLSCDRSLNKENDMYKEIACHSRHIHCLTCLQRSMDEFCRNRQTPVCHRTLCDYELSKHDISLIPLERRLSDRLLKLVKGQQRPLCPKCHFYIDINNDNDSYDEHIESCDDLIPCEYCQLPFSFRQLEDHAIQCRSDKTSPNEKLTNFILTRTKYPFTKQRIRFFIEQQSKTNRRMSLDPQAIITALAEFGSMFPYEMPTRVCDICVESCPYDDIYVFDCPDSHKLCYQCYYQSCQSKMNNGEILTCPLCTNPFPLRDGEINQLRLPIDELKKIREYQMKKTFDAYSSRTKGILKCPKQNCTWVAEAEDPNERFKVNCDLCKHEFCSLCNQQYHYRTQCQQLPQITQRWFFWCQTERNRYLTMRAQQDTTYANQLNDYNKKNKENEDRNKELRRRYDNLINDEQYKATNCRLCPSCKRVVQRLEGCDSMICGQDAHGGNVQSGCGSKFNWAQAQPYKASATQQPRQTIVDLPKPENPVVHHDGVKCDQCQNDVNGIRFDCVHCPVLTFCEKCEQQATLDHSTENQFLGQQQHVFKLIMTPQDEAI